MTSLPLLEELQTAYDKLFASVSDVSWSLSLDGSFTRMGKASETLMGYSPEELIGKPFSCILPQEEFAKMETLYRQSLKGLARGAIHRVRHRDGSERWVFTQSAPLYSKETLIGLVGASRNISDEHKVSERMTQFNKMKSLSDLAGGLAHEFNNILVSILGFSSLVKSDLNEDDPNFGLLAMIEKEGHRGSNLIKRILSFARPNQAHSTLVDMGHLVQEIAQICKGTLGRHVEIEVTCPDDLPTIKGDPSLLSQVFLNLAINARDAMPEGGKLRFVCQQMHCTDENCISTPGLVPGKYVSVNVIDEGFGMEASVCEHIFEPYFTTKAQGEGTGLGLTMVYRIIKDHHGCVAVSTTKGKGTNISVYLPTFDEAFLPKTMPTPEED